LAYVLLKNVHIGLALISITGFVLRWVWMMNGSSLSTNRLVRIAPHVIDTLFLLSGILLALFIGQLPFRDAWLTAKVIGLVVYILLGMIAMSRRNSRKLQTMAFIAALFTFSWIISVAVFKTPWGYFIQ